MKIRVDFEFFRTPAGSVYELVEDSYSMNVCDCCGKPRSCDYYVCKDNGGGDWTFLDLCRSCKKTHAEVVG